MNRTALPAEEAEIVKTYLQEVVFDLIDLNLQAKQAHWNATGPHFRALHLQLDDLVEHLRTFSDTLAERIVALGEPAQGTAGAVDHHSKLDPLPTGYLRDTDVVKLFVERLNGVCTRMRRAIDALGERDPVSAGMVTAATAKLEEQMWMFHAQAQA